MTENKNKKNHKDTPEKTGGGIYVEGGVNTGGGNFVGGNQENINVENGGIYVIGTGNVVNSSIQEIFAPVYHAIQDSSLPEQDKADLAADMKEIEAEVAKTENINENFLARRLRNVKRMAPDIFELLLSALGGPGAVVSTLAKKIAEKVNAEAA